MTLHEFIFTNKRPERYYRHLAFWIAHVIFWSLWAGIFFRSIEEWVSWLIHAQGFFALHIYYHIFFTYLIAYYLWPRYRRTKRYLGFGVSIFILSLFTYVVYVSHIFWLNDITSLPKDEQLLRIFFSLMHFIFSGPLTVCAMFLTFKMLKNYYTKMEEKATLIKETSNAELQLLKAQIHPHFLFNTLNNIYSFNLNKSPQAARLVLKLSDTLKYMINDCEAELVPLEKELKMIQDYMGLEKVRYGKRLTMETEVEGNHQNLLIAPLLLIPFVENCFKHGTSKMLEHPWIKMHISIEQGSLDFKISNSKPANPAKANVVNGIGLKNVRKRLQLLYPNEHRLKLDSEDHSYLVELRVPLHVLQLAETVKGKTETPAFTEIYATQ